MKSVAGLFGGLAADPANAALLRQGSIELPER
jgi:hypothetical protein